MTQHRSSIGTGVLLGAAAGALIVLVVMVANLARAGSVIAGEISRVQGDYLSRVAAGPAAENNALQLGQCLRREMLRAARSGYVHHDTWAVAARVQALPHCVEQLPSLPAPELRQFRAPRHGVIPVAVEPAATPAVLQARATSSPR